MIVRSNLKIIFPLIQLFYEFFFQGFRHIGLQLGEVADFKAEMFSFTQKFNRRTAVEFSTEPAILPNRCCAFVFLKIAFQKPFR